MVVPACKARVLDVIEEKLCKVSITARHLKWKADASHEEDFRRCEQGEGRGIGDDGLV